MNEFFFWLVGWFKAVRMEYTYCSSIEIAHIVHKINENIKFNYSIDELMTDLPVATFPLHPIELLTFQSEVCKHFAPFQMKNDSKEPMAVS